MGQIMLSLFMSMSGLFFAFFRGWWFSLLLLMAFPILLIASIFIASAMQNGFHENMIAYAQSAGYAE